MSQPGSSGGWLDPDPGSPPPPQFPEPAHPPGPPWPPSWGYPPPPAGYQAPAYGPPGYGYGYLPPPVRTNGLAITSLILSISAIVVTICGTACFVVLGLAGLPLGVTGTILGHVGLRQIRQRGENGQGMAMAGLVIGWIATGLSLLAVAVILAYFVGIFTMFAGVGAGGA